MQSERLAVVVLMLIGFLWLRRRGRRMDDAARGKAMLGAALFLVPTLLAGRWLFDRLPYGRYENLVLELAGIAAMIAVAGFVFLKPGEKGN